MDNLEERIRQRALEIWEAEGRPEGREYSHWLQAKAQLREEEEAAGPAGSGEPPRTVRRA